MDNQLTVPTCVCVCLSPPHRTTAEFGFTVSPQFHSPQWQKHLCNYLKTKRSKRCPIAENKQVAGRRGEDWAVISWGGWLTGVCISEGLGLNVVDGRGVRHWLKVLAWCRVESSSVWLWGKEQSINSAKEKVYTKGNHPFLLLLVILLFFLFFFEVKSIVLNWLPGQTFLYPLFICFFHSYSTHTCVVRSLQKMWRNSCSLLFFHSWVWIFQKAS